MEHYTKKLLGIYRIHFYLSKTNIATILNSNEVEF